VVGHLRPQGGSRRSSKVTVLDSQSELMAAALKYLGIRSTTASQALERPRRSSSRPSLLGGVQATGYIECAGRRQHLGWPRLLQRHLPGETWRAGGQAAVPHQACRMPREGAVLALDAMVIHRMRRARIWRCNHQLHARWAELRGSHQHDRLGQSQTARPWPTSSPRSRPMTASSRRATARAGDAQDLNAQQRRLMNRIWTEIKAK